MEKKLVIACQSCGYLLKDIANAYANADYDVTVMTSSDSQRRIEKTLKGSVKMRTVITYDRSSPAKRIFTWLVSAIQMLFMIGFLYRKSKVLYVSNPPVGPLLPLVLHNRFSLLIWDIYPDVLVNQHVISNENVIARWWRNSNRKVYKKAEYVYTLSDGMKKCLSVYVNDEKIKVIPLWPDNSDLHYVTKRDNLFIKENYLEGKFIVMYSGNLGNTHRMDVLVDVAKKIHEDDIVFVLIGEGGKKKIIEQRIEAEGVKNVLLLPYQPYDFLSHSLSAADIAVITLDSVSSQMSVPSKTFNMMSLGAPLMCIASPDSELGNIVKKYQVGELFHPENIDGITEFVLSMKNDEVLRRHYADNSLKASREFSVDNANKFVD